MEVLTMMGWYQDGWGYAGIMGMVLMVAVWGAIIWLAVWAIARFTRTEPMQVNRIESARAILDRRFASGEINAEEYAQTRRTLEATDTQGLTPTSP
jgi:putative membrane protein